MTEFRKASLTLTWTWTVSQGSRDGTKSSKASTSGHTVLIQTVACHIAKTIRDCVVFKASKHSYSRDPFAHHRQRDRLFAHLPAGERPDNSTEDVLLP